MTEELQTYIEENLGMFELIENEDEKIFIFELKINDIDFDSIQETYKKHFKGSLDQFFFKIIFQKNQSLPELLDAL